MNTHIHTHIHIHIHKEEECRDAVLDNSGDDDVDALCLGSLSSLLTVDWNCSASHDQDPPAGVECLVT